MLEPQVETMSATSNLFLQTKVYQIDLIVAGLAHYPNTPGHTKVELCHKQRQIWEYDDTDFIHVMTTIKTLAESIRRTYDVQRCALVTTGGLTLSIIPLHGLQDKWASVTSDVKVFHAKYPGYVSSHDGPTMSPEDLNGLCLKIQRVSGISPPFNHTFGGGDLRNIFSRIIQGNFSHYRLWEDDDHVAFLTPFANTPGFTVLVPRTHLSSDILALDDHDFIKLMLAAKKVEGILAEALGVTRCGMIFEGFEIDYAHVKLIPVNDDQHASHSWFESDTSAPGEFHDTYPGFVTSLDGDTAADLTSLQAKALEIRRQLISRTVVPL